MDFAQKQLMEDQPGLFPEAKMGLHLENTAILFRTVMESVEGTI
jgi:hypothetical protein